MGARVGQRLESRVTLSRRSIAEFARACGDANPLHHDEEAAARTRFGGVIASGPQLSSLLMGLTATRFSEEGAMLGLEFRFRFRRAVRAGETVSLEWEVVAVRPHAGLGGDLAFLVGRVRAADGGEAVRAVGKVLVTDAL